MEQKKLYSKPEIQVTNMGILDVLNISGDPSMEDVDWVS